MVLLASAICTKSGKPLVSRQFVEMTRARVEGLLAAFPKLMGSDSKSGAQKQHTFVETESVRYVYQPMDSLYMLLITTKASNILEDLETLRLFSRVIPEYCRSMEEKEVIENSFNLIFAFDEIVALGYRESVNLAQIRTFTEMESHEEKVYLELKKNQEREAKDKAKEKARELAAMKKDAIKRGGSGGRPGGGGMNYGPSGGFGSDGSGAPRVDSGFGDAGTSLAPSIKSTAPMRPSGPKSAMRLGGKQRDTDSFIDQLKEEGQDVAPTKLAAKNAPVPSTVSGVKTEPVHVRTEEKVNLAMSRDGGVDSFEIKGLMAVRISSEQFQQIKIKVENVDKFKLQLQPHPNLDKKLFLSDRVLTLRNPSKPFPLNTEVGVLKWTLQSTDETHVPLTVNCWPQESGKGGCDVNIEYTLEIDNLELQDVVFTIPLPSGTSPVVNEIDGEYKHDRGRSALEWMLPVIDKSNKTGTLEFSTPTGGNAEDFFPLKVSFTSRCRYCDIHVSFSMYLLYKKAVQKALQLAIVEKDNPLKVMSDEEFNVMLDRLCEQFESSPNGRELEMEDTTLRFGRFVATCSNEATMNFIKEVVDKWNAAKEGPTLEARPASDFARKKISIFIPSIRGRAVPADAREIQRKLECRNQERFKISDWAPAFKNDQAHGALVGFMVGPDVLEMIRLNGGKMNYELTKVRVFGPDNKPLSGGEELPVHNDADNSNQ